MLGSGFRSSLALKKTRDLVSYSNLSTRLLFRPVIIHHGKAIAFEFRMAGDPKSEIVVVEDSVRSFRIRHEGADGLKLPAILVEPVEDRWKRVAAIVV
jgi:hypothetical protein